MSFSLPRYQPPNFYKPPFTEYPVVSFGTVQKPGVAPKHYHATSIYPEYLQTKKGTWQLLKETRMDCVVVLEPAGSLGVKEFRRLKRGEMVACGRRENGEDGIFVHTKGFEQSNRGNTGCGNDCKNQTDSVNQEDLRDREDLQSRRDPRDRAGLRDREEDKFAFRKYFTRETSFSFDYDELYELMEYERKWGFILWVSGPAVVFDRDSRRAFTNLIKGGYVHGLLAGNALAAHDLEGALYGTALGQGLYSKQTEPLGHYKHLDAINTIRELGSVRTGVVKGVIKNGVMYALIKKKTPFVLAGSIRDDGPLPEVVGDAYRAQDRMRVLIRQATTVITLATQLHGIASGNMVPSYRVTGENQVRPVYFYSVDMSEFAVAKLANRGSLTARAILTNVQDFIVNVERGLREIP
jgi:hypothetical protein